MNPPVACALEDYANDLRSRNPNAELLRYVDDKLARIRAGYARDNALRARTVSYFPPLLRDASINDLLDALARHLVNDRCARASAAEQELEVDAFAALCMDEFNTRYANELRAALIACILA